MTGETAGRATVLVVEDEPMLLDIVASELEDAGFDVLRAETGEVAVSMIEHGGPIDLLFTDVRLPGELDGWGLAERARGLSPNLPVIYVTGFSQEAPRPVEGSVLMMKPYRLSAIVATMRRLGVG